jgi:uncharacterized protein YodC (DUF2158 family)
MRAATNDCKPRNFKMEFNMLTSTKQVSIAIAVALGVTLGMPLSPAFSDPAPSSTAMPNRVALQLRNGNLVRLRSGGPLMTVMGVDGDHVKCVWTNWDGQIMSDSFPIDVLQVF